MRQIPRLNEGRHHNLLAFASNYEPAMTFDEIAEALGCNRQTVWVIYARALEKIRRELRRRSEKHRAMIEHQEPERGPVYPNWDDE